MECIPYLCKIIFGAMTVTANISEELLKRVQSIVNGIPLTILGSGASMPYGIPSMVDLGEYLKANITLIDKEDITQFENFKQNLNISNDLETALSNMNLNESVLKAIIEKTWLLINDSDIKAYVNFLSGCDFPLAELVRHLINHTKKQVSIITTNYDRIVEYAASFASALICNGFEQNYFGHFAIETENNNGFGYKGRVKIWKVHGSLDWFKTQDGGNVQLPLRPDIPNAFTPSIVTPGLSKYFETHKNPYRTIMAKADDEIRNANAYMCIGYGFNDDHVQQLLIQGIKAGKPIVVIAKKITEKTRQSIVGNNCKHYILFEEHNDNDTQVYSSEFGDQVIENVSLWDLSTLIRHIK
jgi:hypothetical protein